jgi:AraC-like DNA-binding protein
MPYSEHSRINIGAYDQPFSGVGVEYYSTGVKPGRSGVTLHECGYIKDNTKWNYPGVFSPFWRLYYNFTCGHCVLFGDRMIELTPDHIMLIPDHSLFHCLGKNPVSTFWMAFNFVKRPDPALDIPILLAPRDTELCLIRDLKDLIAANKECSPTDAIYRNSLALLQVVLARPELRWQPPVPDNLTKVVKYVEENIGEKLSNAALSQYAGMSVEGFSRAFKRHYNTTPARFVTEMRVREAGRLLLQTDETIEGIAEFTGFPNRAYFSRIFKKVTGESPAHFRQMHGAIFG